MRKAEREVLQQYVNSMRIYEKEQDDAFKALQEKNKEVNGNACCCAKINYEELLKAGYDYSCTYEKYVGASAKIEVILELGGELANLNFWK